MATQEYSFALRIEYPLPDDYRVPNYLITNTHMALQT